MKYSLLLTAILWAACLGGCQPKEEGGSLAPKKHIEAPSEPAEAVSPSAGEGKTAIGTEDAPAAHDAPAAQDAPPAVTEAMTAEEPGASEGAAEKQPPSGQEKAVDDNVGEAPVEAAPVSADDTEVMPKPDSTEASPTVTEKAAETESEKASDLELLGPRISAAYKDLLSKYVDAGGNVDYAMLRRKRGELYAVVRDFDNVDPREYLPWGRNEKIAFWLNAYNIFTLKIAIDNYPIEPSWAKVLLNYPKNSFVHVNDPWTKKYFKVMGIEYTLREIEREILLGRFGDPRVCLALSYASMGGAILRNEPYYPDKLDEQLDDQARKFMADPRGFEINTAGRMVYLADIFNWYKQDFINKYGDIRKFRDRPRHIQAYLNFIVQYIDADDARYLATQEYTVEFRKYDWRLNEQPNR